MDKNLLLYRMNRKKIKVFYNVINLIPDVNFESLNTPKYFEQGVWEICSLWIVRVIWWVLPNDIVSHFEVLRDNFL